MRIDDKDMPTTEESAEMIALEDVVRPKADEPARHDWREHGPATDASPQT